MRKRIAEEAARLAAVASGVAWVAPENFHVTLKFLGAVEEARLADVTSAVSATAAAAAPFEVAVRGLGAFPAATRARVLWAGTDDPAGRLRGLASAVDEALGALGFPREDRPFAGHVTLGRVREPSRRPALADALAAAAARPFGPVAVSHASIMRSDLSPRGARYTQLAACPLG